MMTSIELFTLSMATLSLIVSTVAIARSYRLEGETEDAIRQTEKDILALGLRIYRLKAEAAGLVSAENPPPPLEDVGGLERKGI